MHVHVAHPEGEAKFCIDPEVALATSVGLSAKQIAGAQTIVIAHIEEIQNAWHHHFSA